MILKVNDTEDFNISMNLNIDFDLKYMEVTVTVWNKKNHTQQTKTFPAQEFSAALDYFDLQERFFIPKTNLSIDPIHHIG